MLVLEADHAKCFGAFKTVCFLDHCEKQISVSLPFIENENKLFCTGSLRIMMLKFKSTEISVITYYSNFLCMFSLR